MGGIPCLSADLYYLICEKVVAFNQESSLSEDIRR